MMKATTILALMEGHKARLNEGLIFWKATGDIERAGREYTGMNHTTESHEFNNGSIPFDIKAGQTVRPHTSYYRGIDVIIGVKVTTAKKVFVDVITDYDVQQAVRPLIAKEIEKFSGQYVGDWQIDCKLTMLYVQGKLTWKEYVDSIMTGC